MAESHTIANSWMTYIKNMPHIYPADNSNAAEAKAINTGWHIFPNILWRHFATPKQWYDMMIRYEAYKVDGFKISVFNMVPMTTQIAIQGNSIFTSFNNTVYGMGYQDKLYETSWYGWYDDTETNNFHNLIYKEGLKYNMGTTSQSLYMLPIYSWRQTNVRALGHGTWSNQTQNGGSGVYPNGNSGSERPTGIDWDPLNRPDEIMEIRPGKNSMSYKWDTHPCDSNKWFNIDQVASWFPYVTASPYQDRDRPGALPLSVNMDPEILTAKYESNPPMNDYTMANWADIPIVPMAWWWHEMKDSIALANMPDGWQLKYIDLYFAGTEFENVKYGPEQCFIKMLPLFDSNGTHIECHAQISVKTELFLTCKKRRSALYTATWGPFNWKQLYSAKSQDRNFINTYIRYRTGGARRTWQNLGNSNSGGHKRETPHYFTSSVNPTGTGLDGTFKSKPIYTQAQFHKSTETVTLKRKPQTTPSAPPMEVEPAPTPDQLYPPLDAYRTSRC
uniref:Capsid protein n=1 Tax=Parvoviridae sp. TaxID=1940570 RepID=A0A7D3QM94_9VIRU|nr:MAG: hypothetical protein [Parvoviridae sp.]